MHYIRNSIYLQIVGQKFSFQMARFSLLEETQRIIKQYRSFVALASSFLVTNTYAVSLMEDGAIIHFVLLVGCFWIYLLI